MPTYGYQCKSCGHQLEVLQKITEQPLTQCPGCNKDDLLRGPGGGIGLQFQGSGFYITDYKNGAAKTSCQSGGGSTGCCPCKNSSSS